jgi:hypothetical protein
LENGIGFVEKLLAAGFKLLAKPAILRGRTEIEEPGAISQEPGARISL